MTVQEEKAFDALIKAVKYIINHPNAARGKGDYNHFSWLSGQTLVSHALALAKEAHDDGC